MFDWDDLRIFLAAARARSLSAAAPRLGVDAATVGRRIARLETSLKSTLLIRSAGGLQLTSAGQRLFEIGLEAEAAMDLASRSADPDAAGGTVRITAAEGFGTTVIAPALPTLRLARPDIRIELAASTGFLSLTRREVDMAITLSPPVSTRLAVQPLTDYRLGLYASAGYLDRMGRPASVETLKRYEIVGYVDDLIFAPELRYLDEVAPGLRPSLSSSSIRAQREIIAADGGIGVLPCFMAAGLERVLPREVDLKRGLWLSTHRDVADIARIRLVRSWLIDLAAAQSENLNPAV
ncbi:LysR family transcriptional regulator [Caulobacter sp. NIBR1757]|uniref:LysR family transcriptional regulator n=1 Tax=Caulobacter sp. NIBR1757 TaxID=3016000 RepID=UPI0022F0AEC2|nr:LysR family transcriptional regulator [Caulobacter sp. NIBR1757]WGM37318.1 HTH-type transcriptional regulator HdfR [Caulobacter sp. NIBR1757]